MKDLTSSLALVLEWPVVYPLFKMRVRSQGILFALIAMSIVGCATPAQQSERQRQMEAQRQRAHQIVLESARARCREYGYTQPTDGFASCVQQEVSRVQHESDAQAQRRQAIAECKRVMMLRPTRSGNFSETAENLNKCDADPHAQLRPEAPIYSCQKATNGTQTCVPS